MIWIWLRRLLFSSRNWFQLETAISLVSLVLAVTCLVVTMTVMSSYETTLKKTLIDRTGHFLFLTRDKYNSTQEFSNLVTSVIQSPYQSTPFLSIEALAIHKGQLQGIFLEGVDSSSVHQVLNLKNHLIKGSWIQADYEVVLGTKVASRLQLDVGSKFHVSYAQWINAEKWTTQTTAFTVSGIVDWGRYDFNSRYIVTSLKSVQRITQSSSDDVTGFRIRLMQDGVASASLLNSLRNQIGDLFFIQGWQEINQNLFRAIQTEKALIFLILLILIVAAGFNISNQLFLGVLTKFRDIGILKTIGASPYVVVQMFLIPAVAISIVGTAIGCLLGVLICYIIFHLYNVWEVMIPSDVYQLNSIILDFRWQDFLSIFVASVLIGVLSAGIPIRKGLQLSAKEGLSVE